MVYGMQFSFKKKYNWVEGYIMPCRYTQSMSTL
jgi:hypothetical protein